MAYRIKLATRAKRDLLDIYDWTGASSSDAAHTWYRGLRNAIRSLSNNPGRCPLTPEDSGLRHLLYGRTYRIIYRVIEKPKQVDVIRHGARLFAFRFHGVNYSLHETSKTSWQNG